MKLKLLFSGTNIYGHVDFMGNFEMVRDMVNAKGLQTQEADSDKHDKGSRT
jgi:hypothetical protein